MKPDLNNKEKLKRKHKVQIKLNDYEFDALKRFSKRYKIENRSQFIRETVMHAILQRFDEDYPSLFDSPVADSKQPNS